MKVAEQIKSPQSNTKSFGKIKSIQSQILFQILSDVVAIVVSFFIQYFIRFESTLFDTPVKGTIIEITYGLIFFVIYWFVLYFFSGMYKNWYERSPFDEIFATIKVNFVGSLIIFFFAFSDSSNSPRMLFFLFFVIMSVSVIIGRTITRHTLRRLRKKGLIQIPVIIIGSAKSALEFDSKTKREKNWGYYSIGVVLCDDDDYILRKNELEEEGIQVLGKTSNIEYIFKEHCPEIAIITSEAPNHDTLLHIGELASDMKIRLKIEPNLYDIFTGRSKTQNLYGIPLIEVNTRILNPIQEIIKRIFDVIFSSLVIIIGFPLWLLIGILVKLDSKGPMFYSQLRVGLNGKNFRIYKFRSMKQNSDKNNKINKELGWTKVNDPRVTRFGRFIRKTHLDEIPQFWNVLIGDMSVVGPRPEQPHLVEEFSEKLPHYKRRLTVRPGITGWWQIKYTQFEFSVEEVSGRLKDDFYYIENLSLKLDIEIVIRTVWAVLKGHGQS